MQLNGHASISQCQPLPVGRTIAASLVPLLSVQNLSVEFRQQDHTVKVVDDLSFDLKANKTLAIVGESGSGKSISSLAILKLVRHLGGQISAGKVFFDSSHLGRRVNLLELSENAMRPIRGNEIAMIFQEPMTSLNPVFTVGFQIMETLQLHQSLTNKEALARARELIDLVRLPNAARVLQSYPHQLSGGQRQRVMIAIALSCKPKILIADEPTTALDVTIQAQILQIIRDLQEELKTAVIFISHDMGVVSQMADEVLIMRQSRKVEEGTVRKIFNSPAADYTKALLAAVPRIGSMKGKSEPEFFHLPAQNGSKQSSNGRVSVPEYTKPLLRVEGLTTRYDVAGGFLGRVRHRIHAVEDVSFSLYPGETLALVGESGSGKSTIGKTIQQLIKPVVGNIQFGGRQLLALSRPERRKILQNIQYVFQDPFGALNPRKKVGASIIEPALTHGLVDSEAAVNAKIKSLLVQVGLEPEHAGRYPHEFSGGQRQRVCIARALSCDPELIIADEAVSALDVSVQAQVLNLLMTLQKERGLSYLFITHDMAVVERVSHRVAVMYLGQLVEIGTRRQIFENPRHPYTKKLMAAVPVVDPDRRPPAPVMDNEIPSLMRPVGYEPAPLAFQEVSKGHFVATNF